MGPSTDLLRSSPSVTSSGEPSARTAKTSAEATYRHIRKLQRPPYGTIHRFVKIISQPYFFKLGARFLVPPRLGWRLAQGRLCSRPAAGSCSASKQATKEA